MFATCLAPPTRKTTVQLVSGTSKCKKKPQEKPENSHAESEFFVLMLLQQNKQLYFTQNLSFSNGIPALLKSLEAFASKRASLITCFEASLLCLLSFFLSSPSIEHTHGTLQCKLRSNFIYNSIRIQMQVKLKILLKRVYNLKLLALQLATCNDDNSNNNFTHQADDLHQHVDFKAHDEHALRMRFC